MYSYMYCLQYICLLTIIYCTELSSLKRTDIANLQSDLNTLAHWSHIWQMEFNIDKCIASY